jgi:hypothetical protein
MITLKIGLTTSIDTACLDWEFVVRAIHREIETFIVVVPMRIGGTSSSAAL